MVSAFAWCPTAARFVSPAHKPPKFSFNRDASGVAVFLWHKGGGYTNLFLSLLPAMFKQSPFYRTDIWVGRYCGSPLAAWTHLLAALGMAAFLYLSPEVRLGWYGALFLLVPGCWLFMTGIFFALRVTVKFVRRDLDSVFSGGGSGLSGLFMTRECVSFFMMMVLLVLSVSAVPAVQFDDADFRQCVATLDPAAQRVLARNAKSDMPRHEFWRACAAARKDNAARPASLEELQSATRN